MKYSFLLIALSFILLLSCTPSPKEYSVYVGTYTDKSSEGIYCYNFQSVTGEMTLKNVTPNKLNPSFLEINPEGNKLYVVSELSGTKATPKGAVIAYQIGQSGKLSKLNEEATMGKHPCHVTISPDGKTVVASSYSSGSLSVFDVRKDGGLIPLKQLIEHEGSGPNKSRQKTPHAHSALFTKDGSILISADLGTDKINLYQKSDDDTYIPTTQGFVKMKPGSGPRHFDFSPNGEFIYVMNELTSTVTVLKKEGTVFKSIQTLSSLPSTYEGENSGADIHVSANGRFVYCSNRGHNSIAVFKRNRKKGTIKLIQNEDVHGEWPRNFTLSPEGNFLLVANQHTSNITVHSVDFETGMLTYTGQNIEVPNPVCLKFLVR